MNYNYCGKCGSALVNNSCPNCTNTNNMNNTNVNTISAEEQMKIYKKSEKRGKICLILSLIPIFLILYCFIESGGDTSEAEDGAVWWLVIVYYMSVGIPLAITSIICGLKSNEVQVNKPASYGLLLAGAPLLFVLLAFIF